MFVGVAIWTLAPDNCHFYERDAVAFHVADSYEEGSSRGGWLGKCPRHPAFLQMGDEGRAEYSDSAEILRKSRS